MAQTMISDSASHEPRLRDEGRPSLHSSSAILVVDDDQEMGELAQAGLTPHGYPVTWRASSEEALAELDSPELAVLLADIHMNGMDGIEVAQHLRKLDPAPAVIFTTAYDAYAIRAFELHAVD